MFINGNCKLIWYIHICEWVLCEYSNNMVYTCIYHIHVHISVYHIHTHISVISMVYTYM